LQAGSSDRIDRRKKEAMMPPLILAEVADKEFTATTVVVTSLVVSGLGYGLVRASKWLVPLAIIPAALWALLVVPELTDLFVGPAILRELGYGYVALSYLSVVCPFIAIGVAFKRRPIQLLRATEQGKSE
jgi:hypothetical protein